MKTIVILVIALFASACVLFGSISNKPTTCEIVGTVTKGSVFQYEYNTQDTTHMVYENSGKYYEVLLVTK
jgi:hypothetical protein